MKKNYLIIAEIFIFISAGIAMGIGIRFMLEFCDPSQPFEAASLTATIFTTIASVIALVTFSFGLVTISKDKYVLVTVILAYLSGIIILSCAFTPILDGGASAFVGLAVAAGIIDVLAGTVFLINFAFKKNKKSNNFTEQQNSVKQLKLLKELYNKKLLSEEEYAAKRGIVLGDLSCEQQADQAIQYSSNKKPLITTIALSVVVMLYCVVAFPIISSVYKSKVYDYVLDTIYYYNRDYLDDYLDYLPNSYKDTRSIKNTYGKVKYSLYIDKYSLFEIEGLRKYVELNKIQKNDSRWNFEKMFDNIPWNDIYNVRWTGEQIWVDLNGASGIANPNAYIEITRVEGDETFYTNLPNDRETNKKYYFYKEFKSNYTIIGYENQNDESDYFRAYKISDIRYNSTSNTFSLNVYCYANSKTYKLEYQYS